MTFYELVIIIQQNITSNDIDNIAEDLSKLIEDNDGEVIKTEYWGLRQMQYTIKNNKEGHYYFFGIKVDNDLLQEIKRKISLNENIIRHGVIQVPTIEDGSSIILQNSDLEQECSIDVTSHKKAPTA